MDIYNLIDYTIKTPLHILRKEQGRMPNEVFWNSNFLLLMLLARITQKMGR